LFHLSVEIVAAWKAHAFAIQSLYVVESPACLLTTSYDHQTKVWSLTGDCLGILARDTLSSSHHHENMHHDNQVWTVGPLFAAARQVTLEQHRAFAHEVWDRLKLLQTNTESNDGGSSGSARTRKLHVSHTKERGRRSTILQDENIMHADDGVGSPVSNIARDGNVRRIETMNARVHMIKTEGHELETPADDVSGTKDGKDDIPTRRIAREHDRLLGQLRGHVTWKTSKAQVARVRMKRSLL
jgi:hypothetical protein